MSASKTIRLHSGVDSRYVTLTTLDNTRRVDVMVHRSFPYVMDWDDSELTQVTPIIALAFMAGAGCSEIAAVAALDFMESDFQPFRQIYGRNPSAY